VWQKHTFQVKGVNIFANIILPDISFRLNVKNLLGNSPTRPKSPF